MRTLASTFSTTEEAEAARRHLESIGIARDRIILKDVAPAAGGSAGSGPEGAGSTDRAFISVKVTTDQVERASEILKGRWREEQEAIAPEVDGRPLPNVQDGVAGASAPHRPVPAPDGGPSTASARDGVAAELWAGSRAAQDRARRSRYLIFFLLGLVAAFMIGAWLGMAS